MRFGLQAQISVVVFIPEAGAADDGLISGELIIPELDVRFPARSGPWGKGALPTGAYHMHKPVMLDPTNVKSGFVDGEGNAWWAKLAPKMDVAGRDGFGIHPDPDGTANVDGTAGCIGIVLHDTREAFEALVKLEKPTVCWVMSEPTYSAGFSSR